MSSASRLTGGTSDDSPDEGAGDGAHRLPCTPDAARAARAYVAETLADWPPASAETVRLLVSEVVTNAVLHARTPVELLLEVQGDRVRVDVRDGSPSAPLLKRYAADAATGRGLRLLAALSDEWGVSRTPSGKSVWFTVGRDARDDPGSVTGDAAPDRPVGHRPIGGWSGDWPMMGSPPLEAAGAEGGVAGLAALERAATVPGAAGARADVVEVCIEGLPIDVYLETEQHNDAVLREFALLSPSAGTAGGAAVPARLLELSEEVRGVFSGIASDIRLQAERALRQGRTRVDLTLAVPTSGWQVLLRLVEQLDEADRFCEEGELVTLVSSPRVRRFRRWYTEQVAAQIAGGAPEPWPEDEPDAEPVPGTGPGNPRRPRSS